MIVWLRLGVTVGFVSVTYASLVPFSASGGITHSYTQTATAAAPLVEFHTGVLDLKNRMEQGLKFQSDPEWHDALLDNFDYSPDSPSLPVDFEEAKKTLTPTPPELFPPEIVKMTRELDDSNLVVDMDAISEQASQKMLRGPRRRLGVSEKTTESPAVSPVMKETSLVPPPNLGMTRTRIYTSQELKHIEKEAKDRTCGLTYIYMGSDVFVQAHKKWNDLSGFCGRIRVLDRDDPARVLYQTGCCYCNCHWRHKGQVTSLEYTLGSMIAGCSALAGLAGCHLACRDTEI